jgi:transposase
MCIYIRQITNEEQLSLKTILRQSKDGVKVKRVQIVLASSQGMKVPQISKTLGFHRKYIESVIHNFNDIGFKALESGYENCGRAPKFKETERRKILEVATSRPSDLGLPFTEWSLEKIKSYLISKGYVDSISIETVRRILKENGVRYRRTKTWEQSTDPNFEIKKNNFMAVSQSKRRYTSTVL